MSLREQYGWNDFFQAQFQKEHIHFPETIPARVISVHRTQYELISDEGVIIAEISGNRLKDKNVETKPVVGDWVLVRLSSRNDAHIIEYIFKRYGVVKRARIRERDVQIMAANVDQAIIVQSLDQDLNPARLERMLVQLKEADIPVSIILNKSDLDIDSIPLSKAINRIDDSLPIIFTSIKTYEGISDFHTELKPHTTNILIGSSGVGKSSLINTLLDDTDKQKTGSISEASGKGRHTTTVRTLVRARNGALIIDVPGTRAFGLVLDESAALERAFLKIEELALQCKFRNCQHKVEPSCAVQAAIAEGTLDSKMLENYRKLKQEIKK